MSDRSLAVFQQNFNTSLWTGVWRKLALLFGAATALSLFFARVSNAQFFCSCLALAFCFAIPAAYANAAVLIFHIQTSKLATIWQPVVLAFYTIAPVVPMAAYCVMLVQHAYFPLTLAVCTTAASILIILPALVASLFSTSSYPVIHHPERAALAVGCIAAAAVALLVPRLPFLLYSETHSNRYGDDTLTRSRAASTAHAHAQHHPPHTAVGVKSAVAPYTLSRSSPTTHSDVVSTQLQPTRVSGGYSSRPAPVDIDSAVSAVAYVVSIVFWFVTCRSSAASGDALAVTSLPIPPSIGVEVGSRVPVMQPADRLRSAFEVEGSGSGSSPRRRQSLRLVGDFDDPGYGAMGSQSRRWMADGSGSQGSRVPGDGDSISAGGGADGALTPPVSGVVARTLAVSMRKPTTNRVAQSSGGGGGAAVPRALHSVPPPMGTSSPASSISPVAPIPLANRNTGSTGAGVSASGSGGGGSTVVPQPPQAPLVVPATCPHTRSSFDTTGDSVGVVHAPGACGLAGDSRYKLPSASVADTPTAASVLASAHEAESSPFTHSAAATATQTPLTVKDSGGGKDPIGEEDTEITALIDGAPPVTRARLCPPAEIPPRAENAAALRPSEDATPSVAAARPSHAHSSACVDQRMSASAQHRVVPSLRGALSEALPRTSVPHASSCDLVGQFGLSVDSSIAYGAPPQSARVSTSRRMSQSTGGPGGVSGGAVGGGAPFVHPLLRTSVDIRAAIGPPRPRGAPQPLMEKSALSLGGVPSTNLPDRASGSVAQRKGGLSTAVRPHGSQWTASPVIPAEACGSFDGLDLQMISDPPASRHVLSHASQVSLVPSHRSAVRGAAAGPRSIDISALPKSQRMKAGAATAYALPTSSGPTRAYDPLPSLSYLGARTVTSRQIPAGSVSGVLDASRDEVKRVAAACAPSTHSLHSAFAPAVSKDDRRVVSRPSRSGGSPVSSDNSADRRSKIAALRNGAADVVRLDACYGLPCVLLLFLSIAVIIASAHICVSTAPAVADEFGLRTDVLLGLVVPAAVVAPSVIIQSAASAALVGGDMALVPPAMAAAQHLALVAPMVEGVVALSSVVRAGGGWAAMLSFGRFMDISGNEDDGDVRGEGNTHHERLSSRKGAAIHSTRPSSRHTYVEVRPDPPATVVQRVFGIGPETLAEVPALKASLIHPKASHPPPTAPPPHQSAAQKKSDLWAERAQSMWKAVVHQRNPSPLHSTSLAAHLTAPSHELSHSVMVTVPSFPTPSSPTPRVSIVSKKINIEKVSTVKSTPSGGGMFTTASSSRPRHSREASAAWMGSVVLTSSGAAARLRSHLAHHKQSHPGDSARQDGAPSSAASPLAAPSAGAGPAAPRGMLRDGFSAMSDYSGSVPSNAWSFWAIGPLFVIPLVSIRVRLRAFMTFSGSVLSRSDGVHIAAFVALLCLAVGVAVHMALDPLPMS